MGVVSDLTKTPCVRCGTPVTVYPPVDGEDCRATCGRCAHSPTAVIQQAVTERIAERKAGAITRQQARRSLRVELAARRTFGLAARHATKLSRTDEGLPE